MAGGKFYNATKKRKGLVRRRRGRRSTKMVTASEKMTYTKAKSLSMSLMRRTLVSNVYNFIRYVEDDLFTITSDKLVDTGVALSFKLSDLANHIEFTTLFDSYQIAKVELEFVPDVQTVNRRIINDSPPVFTIPSIYVHRDLDNAIAPTTESQVLQRQDCIRKNATQRFRYTVVPQVGREIYRNVTQTAYETPYALTWLDCNYADVPHYGVHALITPTASTQDGDFTYKIKAKYWLRFKTVI